MAIGRLEPIEVVELAAVAPGRIEAVTADYNDQVKKGQILARLDAALFQVEVDRAKALVVKAQSKTAIARAKMSLAKRHFERLARLRDARAVDETEFETARGELEVAEGGMRLEDAALAESTAALKRAELELSYCTIVSPIDGVVLDRRCTVGQVVAAGGGSALFRIASDLKKLRVMASVVDDDIGRVAAGQAAEITVDALPGQRFQGKVSQVRLNATVTDRGVVFYTVVIPVDNPDGKLLPYMTARVNLATGEGR